MRIATSPKATLAVTEREAPGIADALTHALELIAGEPSGYE